ncbi:MAG: hypothetical protein HYZ21_07845, partial [Chloroflexi bacterium]|nr:hypothetical protein [Chloroflexota bacterium]
MKIKNILPIFLAFSMALTACGPGQLFGPTVTTTATITLTPTNTSTPTATLTPTPIPPTSTPTPIPIFLTDGTHKWFVKSVTLGDTSEYPAPADYFLLGDYTYLTIGVESADDMDLVSFVMGLDADSGITKISLRGGFAKIYVADSQNDKYHALEIAQDYITIPVKEGASGFTLYFLDLEPVELGK